MQFIFAAFALISFVHGKSVIIHEDPVVEVKHVDNQQHILSLPSGEVSLLQEDNSHISLPEIGIKLDIDPNLKETNIVIGTTNSEKKSGLFPNLLDVIIKQDKNSLTSLSESVNPAEPKLETVNEAILETNSKNVLPSLLDGEVSINQNTNSFTSSSESVNPAEPKLETANEAILETNSKNVLPSLLDGEVSINQNANSFASSSESVNPAEPKLETANEEISETNSQESKNLQPNFLGRGIRLPSFLNTKYGYTIKGNDLYYTSKWGTFLLERGIDRSKYLKSINKWKLSPYISLSDSVKPLEQKLETNSVVIPKTNSKSNKDFLPASFSGGISSRRIYDNEDDDDIKGNDLFYTSGGRTYPLTRSFNGRNYFNNVYRKTVNPYISSSGSYESPEEKLETNNVDIPKINSKFNNGYLPNFLGGGISSRRIFGNEDEDDINGNVLFYSSGGRTYPLTRSFNGRNYLKNVNRKTINSYISSSGSHESPEHKLETKNVDVPKTGFKTNNDFLPGVFGGGASSRRTYDNEDEDDIKGNDLFYSSGGRTYPLTRSFNGRNSLHINRKTVNPYISLSSSHESPGQKLETNNVVIPKTDSKTNNDFLLGSFGGGASSRRIYDNEDDDDINGNELFYSSGGRTYPLTRSFNGRNHLKNVNRKTVNSYISSSGSHESPEQKLKTNVVIPTTDSKTNNDFLLGSFGGGASSRRIYDNEDEDDINGNELFYSSGGRTYPLTRSFNGRNSLNINRKSDDEPSFDFVNPTGEKIEGDVLISHADSQNNPFLLPSLYKQKDSNLGTNRLISRISEAATDLGSFLGGSLGLG